MKIFFTLMGQKNCEGCYELVLEHTGIKKVTLDSDLEPGMTE